MIWWYDFRWVISFMPSSWSPVRTWSRSYRVSTALGEATATASSEMAVMSSTAASICVGSEWQLDNKSNFSTLLIGQWIIILWSILTIHQGRKWPFSENRKTVLWKIYIFRRAQNPEFREYPEFLTFIIDPWMRRFRKWSNHVWSECDTIFSVTWISLCDFYSFWNSVLFLHFF